MIYEALVPESTLRVDADPSGVTLRLPLAKAAPGTPCTQTVTILTSPWEGDIDLSTKQGKSLWDEAIKQLENKFN